MYYNERLLNGQTDQDAGASISDIYRAGNKFGICDESLMPYDDSDFTTPPSQAAYDQGTTIRAHTYAPIPQIDVNIIGCLHHNQAPVNYGIMVYPSFMAARDGNIPMPGDSEDAEGGHATDIVGYNRTAQPQPCDELQTQIPPMTFVFRNSWGILWGQKGYGFIPFAYVLNRQLASDLWFIRAI
jgi:C1A family cysteine protease